jgi:hypothetical protein
MKRMLSVILLGLFCLMLFSAFAPKVKAQQSTVDWWPTFRHDLTHTGYSTSTVPLTNQLLWNYTTGNSVAYSSPAVVNGVVYVGSEDDYVYALDAATGAYIWSYKTGNKVDSSPALANGVVYVGSEDDNVYALGAIAVPEFPNLALDFSLVAFMSCASFGVVAAKRKRIKGKFYKDR